MTKGKKKEKAPPEPAEPLQLETIKQWKEQFKADPKNILARNACAENDPFEICINRDRVPKVPHKYSHKIPAEAKPITNQKSSSRCWLFAALNVMRVPFIKHHNLEEFEFSQAYLYYWDKIERSYYFLNNVVDLFRRGEKPDSRLMSFLLKNPIEEGGQWHMFVNLVLKYGVMPKQLFPETWSSDSSSRMNTVLESKLREYAKILREMIRKHATKDDLNNKIKEQMVEVYNIVGICIGIPEETFNWEYHDKTKKYHRTGQITPMDFYKNFVLCCYNIEDKICLVDDPRECHFYKTMYTVEYQNNMVGGRSALYNNQPMKHIVRLMKKSIMHGEPVWFGCDIGKRVHRKLGILDLEINDFKSLLGVNIETNLRKEDRLTYGDSSMNHAMMTTAFYMTERSNTSRFRVENSWGEEVGDKGYFHMTDEWFIEFAFAAVIDKYLIPMNVIEAIGLRPVVLPPWDPMGSLAR